MMASRPPRNAYLSLVGASIQRSIAYRSARALNLITSATLLMMQYFAFSALFAAKPDVARFSWPDMRTYMLVTFVLAGLLPTDYERRLHDAIRRGDIATDLTRPLDFQWAQFSLACGAAITELSVRVVLVLLMGATILDARLPPSPMIAGMFLVSMFLGLLCRFLITYAVGLCCFFLLNVLGLQWVRNAVTMVLSGAVVPLAMLPGPLAAVARASPFPGMIAVPVSIYIGRMDAASAAQAMAIQVGWVVLLWFAARGMWRFCMKRFIVQGG